MVGKVISIHQPENLPWLGFFHKMALVDEFIILDNVQFRKNYFHNRNKIRTQDGWQWLTVPIAKHPSSTIICNIQYSDSNDWKTRNLNRIKINYSSSDYFKTYFDGLKAAYASNDGLLSSLNMNLIKYIKTELNIDTPIMFASQIVDSLNNKGNDLVLNLCNSVGADIYLSGVGGHNYLNEESFKKNGIRVIYQKFTHPMYSQCFDPFIPSMSIIDLLLNHGEGSKKILFEKGNGNSIY